MDRPAPREARERQSELHKIRDRPAYINELHKNLGAVARQRSAVARPRRERGGEVRARRRIEAGNERAGLRPEDCFGRPRLAGARRRLARDAVREAVVDLCNRAGNATLSSRAQSP